MSAHILPSIVPAKRRRVRYRSPTSSPKQLYRELNPDISSPPQAINRPSASTHPSDIPIVTPVRQKRRTVTRPADDPAKPRKISTRKVHPNSALEDVLAVEAADSFIKPNIPSPDRFNNEANGSPDDFSFRQNDQSFPDTPIRDPFHAFVDAVFSEVCNIYQLSQDLFIVRGWNSVTHTTTPNWYHLQKIEDGGEIIPVCMCPTAQSVDTCFHHRFIVEYQSDQFPLTHQISRADELPFLFSRSRETEAEALYLNLFSIPQLPKSNIKNRAVVQFLGDEQGNGTWKCNKHTKAINCAHISQAVTLLRRIEQRDDPGDDSHHEYTPNFGAEYLPKDKVVCKDSVSYQPIPPPVWCRILTDAAPPLITPIQSPPEIIHFHQETASCGCTGRPRYNPQAEITQMNCTIYGLSGAWRSRMEVQKCQKCSAHIGPDCRDIGVFNWNNTRLFSHELLDDYTSFYTASETPFTAWISVVSRRYSSGQISFVSENEFRTVWFLYIQLVEFESETVCPRCGPSPNAIIFDGVSIAINTKNVVSTLRPPTTIHPTSVVRDKTHRVNKLQCIPDSELRRQIRRILKGPSLSPIKSIQEFEATSTTPSSQIQYEVQDEDAIESGSSDDDVAKERNRNRREHLKLQKNKALMDRFKLIPTVVKRLYSSSNKAYEPLATLFERYFGVSAVLNNTEGHNVYRALFLQICAEETSLQMMNNLALRSLENYIHLKTRKCASELKLIPSLYNVLQHEFCTLGEVQKETFGVAIWLYKRGELVRQSLLVDGTDGLSESLEQISWKTSGCYYEMPQIRHRPQYPQLKEDKQVQDNGSEYDGGCKKYYSKYSPKKLTGGIMVAWCPHSVSYGFHCIPVAEGRNDVFSALYTRWKTAPSVVVYDFACALQPYCMLREPEFFQNTLFAIDDFHSKDHTKCCASSFLSTYCQSDGRLLRINSSAGECGNSGLARIRKSVSYMGQERAVLYCMVFLSVWNRHRIRKMERMKG